jgi:Leucine-rich repeat (LRR) protein
MPLHRRALIACLLGGGLVLAGLGGLTFSSAQEPAGGNPDTVAQASGEAVSAALGSRVLHFPKDRSVGTLSIQDENATRQIEACFYWVDGTQREEIGPAIGDVAIPAGKRVQLMVSDEGSQDMSFLAALGPDDLYELGFGGLTALGARFAGADAGLKHASHLTGVRVLGLRLAPITAAGFKHLSKMQSVERIYMPMRANNSTLKPLRMFPKLKAVYLESPQITDAGLPDLESLDNLEELELATDRLTGAGLRGLARLRSLRYLFLHGQDSAEAILQLQAPPSLRILCVNVRPFGDAGVQAISRLKQLERFSAHWDGTITDRGVGYLARLPNLKKLDIGSAQITDEGAKVLGQIRTLEYLDLPAIGLTDAGLAHVANLQELKFLSVGSFTGSPLTDQTLARLAGLSKLEDLNIGGTFTDEGMKSLGGVQSLKALSLMCAPHMDPRVTDVGLAHLGRLTRLQRLNVGNLKRCTLSGLAGFKDLKDLRMLHVHDARQDQGGMDLSGMVRLEDLLISMYGQRVGQNVVFDPMIDEDLHSLPKLVNLRRIQLSHRGFTDRGLQYLSGLKNAEFINLGGPGITDAGFVAFSGLPKLNWLIITGGEVTDRALKHLESAPSLARLEIKSDRAISPQAVDALKAKLPHLTDVQINR